jgi:transcriptional regulator with XRE-family HTH domain
MSEPSPADPIDVEIGQRLRAFRLAKNMSQTALGAAAGVSFQQVQKYEQAKNRLSASTMCKLAEVLEINPADLLPPACCGRSIEGLTGAFQDKSIVEALNAVWGLPRERKDLVLKVLRALIED